MSYIINNFRGQTVAVIPDGTVDTTSTLLQLVGRNVIDYGTAENENYVWIMENFANPTAPTNPIEGQWWYNTIDRTVYYRKDTGWEGVASITYVDSFLDSPVFMP